IYRRKSFTRSGESAFTQQVVNSNITTGRRKISPSNSFNKPVLIDSHLSRSRIAKVQRARLYLLQQAGPNSFLIGGDSPDHKFKVIIGPQTCSCGKGPHCVHVLFVMLRVFQIKESDPMLWSRTLKNYEVETLFREYRNKMSLRIRMKKERQKMLRKEGSLESSSTDGTTPHSEIDTEGAKEEDDICSICLLEMLEGESLLKCENGCQNRLHHHCIAVWFELCRRQNDPLICPLCRAKWKTHSIEIKSSTEPPTAPPNTRAPSPQPESRLPHPEPIPDEHMATAAPWIEVLGEEIISCLFARDWSIRELGLKHLGKEIQAVLMRSMGEGRSGAVISKDRSATTHKALEVSCQILAFMCADPVYKVYVSCLRTLRTILSYTPCRELEQKSRLERFLAPVLDAVIVKSTDGLRKTSQLSLSTVIEFAKGQNGELTIGKEIAGSQDLDSLDYVIGCVTKDYNSDSVTWQWLLGRLYVLERIFDEFHNDLLPRNPPEGKSGDEESVASGSDLQTSSILQGTVHDRLLLIARFCIKVVGHPHMKICRMARRVFFLVARFSAHIDTIVNELKEMLNGLDSNLLTSMQKRLERIVEDFMLSERIVQELHHGTQHMCSKPSPPESPEGTPPSSPRCNSPVTISSHSDGHSDTLSNTGKVIPLAPPNTPIRCRRKCKFESQVEEDLSSNDHMEIPEEEEGEVLAIDIKAVSDKVKEISLSQGQESSSPGLSEAEKSAKRTPPPIPPRPPSRRGSYEILQQGPILCSPGPPPPDFILQKPDLINSCSAQSSKGAERTNSPPPESRQADRSKMTLPIGEKRKTSLNKDDKVMLNVGTEKSYQFPPPLQSSISNDSAVYLCDSEENIPLQQRPCPKHEVLSECEVITEQEQLAGSQGGNTSLSSDERTLSSDDSLDRRHKRTTKRRIALPSAEQGGTSSDEILDLSVRSKRSTDSFVTFKTEVTAGTPRQSPNTSVVVEHADSGPCVCKEEVEREEALALAKAMEVSAVDPPKPVVPGLTPTDREEVITIRIQPDNYDSSKAPNNKTLYLENVHWVKGPLLGTGAYSTCYQARDVKTGVIMAVKQISFCRNSRTEQETVVSTIEEEIIMMTKLSHPNVVRIMGATRQGCHFNMFVEWMPGGSIAYLLGQYGAFAESVITSYTLQMLRGLAYLHDNHVLHRDLKGANLLVDSTGQRLRIGDFGAAARLASKTTGAGEFQGQLLGTIAFMAPEVLRGEDYGRACDVWSLGCVIIEMSTTQPPWNAKDISNHLALIFKIATSMSPPPVPENLSPPIKDLLLRCLEQEKTERPSAKDLLLHPLFTQYMSNYR
ncbi:hypothetical protein FSP39_001643, partial [Pinctada imbricata]